MPFSANHTFSVFKTAFNICPSPPAMECSGVCGLFNHSLLAQAGPITQLTHAWDRPSVIQIVCTTYGSPNRKETWQPLISEDLSVGQASGVSTAQAWRGGRGWWDLGRRLRRSGTWVLTSEVTGLSWCQFDDSFEHVMWWKRDFCYGHPLIKYGSAFTTSPLL